MTIRTPRTADPANPREGQRLELCSIAAELGITFKVMAAAAEISITALFNIANESRWPAKTDHGSIRDALRTLFAERGANDEQLQSMFHAHVTRRRSTLRNGDFIVPPEDRQPQPTRQLPIVEEETTMLPTKQILSPLARKAFQLFVNPFEDGVISDEQMFTSNEVAFARETCLQAAMGGRFVALVGESGAGKSTILEDLEVRIDKERRPVQIIRPSVVGMEGNDRAGKATKTSELLMAIVQALNPSAIVKQTLQGRTDQVEKLLADSCGRDQRNLLLIEEAHSLPIATLKHLKRMNELRLGRRPLIGILLVAQPELKSLLRENATYLREVIQRLEIVDLHPLDNDLRAYLSCRVAATGRKFEELIDNSAIDEIRARLTTTRRDSSGKSRTVSQCYPLAVQNLLTAALNHAAEISAQIVDRDVIRGTPL